MRDDEVIAGEEGKCDSGTLCFLAPQDGFAFDVVEYDMSCIASKWLSRENATALVKIVENELFRFVEKKWHICGNRERQESS